MHYMVMVTDSKGTESYVTCKEGTDQPTWTYDAQYAEHFPDVCDAANQFSGMLQRGDLELAGDETVEFVPVKPRDQY